MMLLKNLFIMTIFVILAGCGGGGGGSTNAVGEGELNSDSWRLFNRITPISVHDFEFNKYFDNLAKVYDNSICKGTFSYKGEGSVSCYDRLTLSHIFTAKNNDMWAAEFTIVNDSLYTVGGDSVFRLHAYSLSGSNATLENSFQIEGSRYTNNVHAIIAYDSDRKLAVLTATNVYKYDISGGADSINLIESLNFDPGHASASVTSTAAVNANMVAIGYSDTVVVYNTSDFSVEDSLYFGNRRISMAGNILITATSGIIEIYEISTSGDINYVSSVNDFSNIEDIDYNDGYIAVVGLHSIFTPSEGNSIAYKVGLISTKNISNPTVYDAFSPDNYFDGLNGDYYSIITKDGYIWVQDVKTAIFKAQNIISDEGNDSQGNISAPDCSNRLTVNQFNSITTSGGLTYSETRLVHDDNFKDATNSIGRIVFSFISGVTSNNIRYTNDFAFGYEITNITNELMLASAEYNNTADTVFYFDRDNDPNTGYSISGIGADAKVGPTSTFSDSTIGNCEWSDSNNRWEDCWGSGSGSYSEEVCNGFLHEYGAIQDSTGLLSGSTMKGILAIEEIDTNLGGAVLKRHAQSDVFTISPF